jgi:hypothetical protein
MLITKHNLFFNSLELLIDNSFLYVSVQNGLILKMVLKTMDVLVMQLGSGVANSVCNASLWCSVFLDHFPVGIEYIFCPYQEMMKEYV